MASRAIVAATRRATLRVSRVLYNSPSTRALGSYTSSHWVQATFAQNGSGDRARDGAGWLPLVAAAAVAWPVILGGENRGVSKADAPAGVREPPGVKLTEGGAGSVRNHGLALGRYFVADAVEAASPSVVNVTMNVRMRGGHWMPMYGMQSGSGFIIREDGLVVTNAHVVEAGGPVMVTLNDGRKFEAVLHSADPRTDVALLKLDAPKGEKFAVARIGKSSSLKPGEWVVALGSPQGLANTVTVGIVSAVARMGSELGLMHTRAEYIQTDAAINQGNSGGPLVNLDGEVVGISSMKLEFSDGIGFAIPIDIAWHVVQQLIEHKRVRRPYIGLTFRLMAIQHDTLFGTKRDLGVLITEVKPASPAEKAGLEEGDVIVEFDGQKITSLTDIADRIGLEPGKTFTVKVMRQHHKATLTFQVTSAPDDRVM